MSDRRIQLLYALDFEIEMMRTKLRLARIIGEYPNSHDSKNAVLNFALDHATVGVIEWLLLRISEALIHVLNPAAQEFLNRDVLTRKGRTWDSPVAEFKTALELRDENIAHRVANLVKTGGGVPESIKPYGGVYPFLEQLLTRIGELLHELEETGIYDGIENLQAGYAEPDEFTRGDLERLINAANAVLPEATDADQNI